MDPLPISKLLEKYRTGMYIPGKAGRKHVAEAVNEVLSVSIREEQVSIRGGTAYLTLHPAVKSSVWARKRDILHILSQKEGCEHITDIN